MQPAAGCDRAAPAARRSAPVLRRRGSCGNLAEVRPEHEQDRLAPPFVHAPARLIGRALHELPVEIADPVERAERAAHPRLAEPELAVLVERPAIDREGELDPPGALQ